jgi:hypothetical protein
MSRDFERWRSPAGLGTNSFSLCLAHCANGTQPAGLVRHCHAFHGNDAFYKSATVDFRNASSMRVLRGGDKRSPRGIRSPHPWRSCPLGQVLSLLSYASFSRLGEMPSLISSLPPPRQGGEAFFPSFLVKGRVLPRARQHLVGLAALGRACQRAFRGHHSWMPSRKW